jgi:iron-sulfur cluster assembly protein
MSEAVIITEAARAQMIAYLRRQDLTTLHFGVSGKGCGGFSYVIQPYEIDRDGAPALRIALEDIDEKSSRELIIDVQSFIFVLGTTIDWRESAMGGAYVFSNPQAQSTCGCGTSFSV